MDDLCEYVAGRRRDAVFFAILGNLAVENVYFGLPLIHEHVLGH